jgi:hypothetical protein
MDYFSGRGGPTGPSGWWRPIGLDRPVSCHAGGEGGDGADGSEEGGDDRRQWEGVGKTELGFFLNLYVLGRLDSWQARPF